jgi:hypothetical protein
MDLVDVVQDRDQWEALVNIVTNLWEISEYLHNWLLPDKGSGELSSLRNIFRHPLVSKAGFSHHKRVPYQWLAMNLAHSDCAVKMS